MHSAIITGINRIRINTDGDGVTTLVCFYGCPLNCKYCINPHTKNFFFRPPFALLGTYNPKKLFDEVKKYLLELGASKVGYADVDGIANEFIALPNGISLVLKLTKTMDRLLSQL